LQAAFCPVTLLQNALDKHKKDVTDDDDDAADAVDAPADVSSVTIKGQRLAQIPQLPD